MPNLEKISSAEKSAKNYPELASKLISMGIHSYTVDVASQTVFYRLKAGQALIKYSQLPLNSIADSFNEDHVQQALQRHMSGNSDYQGFIKDIAAAGVRF